MNRREFIYLSAGSETVPRSNADCLGHGGQNLLPDEPRLSESHSLQIPRRAAAGGSKAFLSGRDARSNCGGSDAIVGRLTIPDFERDCRDAQGKDGIMNGFQRSRRISWLSVLLVIGTLVISELHTVLASDHLDTPQ